MVKSKSKDSGKEPVPQKTLRESKRTHKPKLIYDPSDSGEQHAASKSKSPEKEHASVSEEKSTSSRGVKKSIVKANKKESFKRSEGAETNE